MDVGMEKQLTLDDGLVMHTIQKRDESPTS